MPIAGICELVLEADDVGRLRSFYEELGLEHLMTEDGGRVWLRAGRRCRLGIWPPGEKEFSDRGGRHVHFAFSVGAAEDGDGAEDGVMALAEDGNGA